MKIPTTSAGIGSVRYRSRVIFTPPDARVGARLRQASRYHSAIVARSAAIRRVAIDRAAASGSSISTPSATRASICTAG